MALATAAALAQEPNPFYIGASQAFTHETNVFRAQSGQVSDWHSATALLAGVDQPIGRHRLFGDAAVRSVKYNDTGQLDHSGGSLLLGWDWSALDVLSGRLSAQADRSLARYTADLGVPGFQDRNLQSTQEIVLRAQYGGEALLAVDGGFRHRKLEYSAVQFAGNEFEQNTLSLGVRYRPTGPLSAGVGIRHTEGKYPNVPDEFDRDDIDLSAVWVVTGQSTITARISRTKENHETLAPRNVSETTGALAWTYKPTGKLETTLDLVRDTGAEATFSGITGAPLADTSLLSNTVQLRGKFELTGKVQLNALARHQRRDLVGSPGGAVGVTGKDNITEFRLGADWAPLRSVLVGCSVARERRASSSVLVTPYSASIASCLAQLKLQ